MDIDLVEDSLEDALYAVGSDVSVFGDYDENPHTDTAWVCYILIALYAVCNALMFPYLGAQFPNPVLLSKAAATEPPDATDLYHFSKDVLVQFGFYLPSGTRILSWHNAITPVLSLLVLPSIFQIIINPFIIWVFGDNIEYALGRLRFLGFYMLTGLLSLAVTVLLAGASIAPLSAAMGSVSAIMGGYARLFPGTRFNSYRCLNIFPVLRTKMWQTGLKTYVFWLMAGNIVFTWLFTSFEAFWAALMLPLSGFALGYLLVPYFRDPDTALEETLVPKDTAPRKDFSSYNTSIDPTDKRHAPDSLDPDGDGLIEYPRRD